MVANIWREPAFEVNFNHWRDVTFPDGSVHSCQIVAYETEEDTLAFTEAEPSRTQKAGPRAIFDVRGYDIERIGDEYFARRRLL